MSDPVGEPSTDSPGGKYFYLAFIFAALLITASLYCRFRLLSVPLERDEGGFGYIAQQMLHGIPPFESGNMKSLTGLYVVYALILAIFGETATGIHAGLLVVNILCIGLMFLLAKNFLPRGGALVTAGMYAYLSTSEAVLGVFAHATHFVILFALAGLLVLLKALRDDSSPLIFAAGLFLGAAVEMKQHGLFFCLFAFFILLNYGRGGRQSSLKKSLLLFLGILIPYGLNAFYMIWHGLFREFWFWTVTYSLNYANENSLAIGLRHLAGAASTFLAGGVPAALLAMAGVFFSWKSKAENRISGFPLYFTIFSLGAITPGLYFYPHYFVLLLPAVSLLVGVAFTNLSSSHFLHIEHKYRGSGMALTCFILIAASLGIVLEREYFFTLSPEAVCRKLYMANPFSESFEVAKYIKSQSAPSAKIAVIGSEPQICFYADRASATDYLYMYGLCIPHPNVTKMQDEMMGEIEAAFPEFVVVVDVDASWLFRGEGGRIIDWLGYYLRQYQQVGLVEIKPTGTIYTWGKDAEGKAAADYPSVAVYRRNETEFLEAAD